MCNAIVDRSPKRAAIVAAAVVLIAGLCVGAWIAQVGDSTQVEQQAPRSFVQLADEIETARLAAETCRAIIDKPLRCLP